MKLIVKLALGAALVILVFAAMALFIRAKDTQMKVRMDKALAAKDAELQDRIEKEGQAVSKDLGEKFQAEKALYDARVASLESEKEKSEKALLEEKLGSAAEAWLGSAREKITSLKDKLIRPARKELPDFPEPYDWCYLRGYSFSRKGIDIIKTGSPLKPYTGYANIEENLFIEKTRTPDISDLADLLYTVSTPIKLNFEYRDGRFVYKNEEYGEPSVRKGWPGV